MLQISVGKESNAPFVHTSLPLSPSYASQEPPRQRPEGTVPAETSTRAGLPPHPRPESLQESLPARGGCGQGHDALPDGILPVFSLTGEQVRREVM